MITDPSGAVVPNAGITVTDIAKGVAYKGTSDAVGRYLVRPLPPSTYRVTIEAEGFKPHTQENVVLTVNQSGSLDIRLALSGDTQTIEVSASAMRLATQDAVTGQELDRKYINDLPLLGRNVFDLAGLTPGITQPSGGFSISFYSTNFVSNGSRTAQTDVLMDGVTTTSYEPNSGVIIPLYQPSVDAVQEFKVQQSNFSAEIGFTASTVVNLVTRSGTNQFHGSANWFLRNNVLTANDWFSNAYGQGMAPRRYNRVGGTVGGPIRRDKTFFFFNLEGLRDVSATTFQAGVPSEAMRNGDFGEICTAGFSANGRCEDPEGQLWDPYTGVYDPAEGGPVRSGYIPFNNLATYESPGAARLNGTSQQLPRGPGNLIDPASQKVMSYFPMPNVNVGQPGYNRFVNWYGVGSNRIKAWQSDTKVDHWFSSADQSSFKFSRQIGKSLGASAYKNLFNPTYTGPGIEAAVLFAMNHTHTFGPRTVLTFSYGYTRSMTDSQDNAQSYDEDAFDVLGMPSYMKWSGFKAAPSVAIYDYAAAADVNIGSLPYALLKMAMDTHHVNAALSRIQGRHELKFGTDSRMHRTNFVQPGLQAGGFSFDRAMTAQHYGWGGGDAMASFLTGVGVGGSYDIPAWVSTQNFAYSGYFQDNWRVTDRLTLNLGLRYELETPRTERFDRQSFLDPDYPSPLQVPGLPNLKGALQFVDKNNRSPWGWDRNNFAPRFGFAYRLDNRSVVRGGYGVFYAITDRGASGTGGGGSLGYSRSTAWLTNYMQDGQTPCCRFHDPFPDGGPNLPIGSSLGAMSFLGEGVSGPMRNQYNATPYEQSWSFGLQRETRGGFLFDANYVGKKGTKLYFGGSGQLNYLGPEIESYTADQITQLNTMVDNPFYGVLPASTPLGGPQLAAYQLQRPFPQYTSFSTWNRPFGNSSYHALQLKAERRFSGGFQALVTYTIAKSLDDSSTHNWMTGIGSSLQDPNNRRLERSYSNFDIPQVLGISYVYELPFGRGKAVGNSWHPVVNAVLGGWRTNAIWRFSSGLPLALGLSQSKALPTYGRQRPDLTAPLVKTTGENFREQYFANPEVAVKPAPFTLGNAPRTIGSVRAPGVQNANLSLLKEFAMSRIREGMKLEFRTEAFNALNHAQFAGPVTTVGDSNFGHVFGTSAAARELQLGLKLYW
ncbi:MAG: TonB-dependent receptor domain-containing protein [Acidobacteriota bacterium]